MSFTSPQYKYAIGDYVWYRMGDDGWELAEVEDRRVRETDGMNMYRLDLGMWATEHRCKVHAPKEGVVI